MQQVLPGLILTRQLRFRVSEEAGSGSVVRTGVRVHEPLVHAEGRWGYHGVFHRPDARWLQGNDHL